MNRHSYQDLPSPDRTPRSPFDSTETPTPTGGPHEPGGGGRFTADIISQLHKLEGEADAAMSVARSRDAILHQQHTALHHAQVRPLC